MFPISNIFDTPIVFTTSCLCAASAQQFISGSKHLRVINLSKGQTDARLCNAKISTFLYIDGKTLSINPGLYNNYKKVWSTFNGRVIAPLLL